MMIKRMSAMLLALVMCLGVFSTPALAYSDDNVAAVDTTEATEPDATTSVEEQGEESEDVLPYNVIVKEDGIVSLHNTSNHQIGDKKSETFSPSIY